MKIGTVVKNIDKSESDLNDRNTGTVLNIDFYNSNGVSPMMGAQPIIKVLWESGRIDWILRSRVEVICEDG